MRRARPLLRAMHHYALENLCKSCTTVSTIIYLSFSPDKQHDIVSKAYDFSELPPGAYNVAGNYTFNQINSTGAITTITPDSTPYHTFNLVHQDANPELKMDGSASPDNSTTPSTGGPSFINCTESQERDLVSAAQVAQGYASGASLYANSVSGWTSRYSTWFGFYSKSRRNLVASQFSAISASNFSAFTYDCSCTTSNVYAYVYPNE